MGEGRRGALKQDHSYKGWSSNNPLELSTMDVGDYPPYSYFFDRAGLKRHYWCAYHGAFYHGTDRWYHKPPGWKYGDPTDPRPRVSETIQQSYVLTVDDDGTYVRTIHCSSSQVEISSSALRHVQGITKYGLGLDSITVRTTQRAILQFQLRLDSAGMQCDAIVCDKSLYHVIIGCRDYERMFAPIQNDWDKLLFIPINEVIKTTQVFMKKSNLSAQLEDLLLPTIEWKSCNDTGSSWPYPGADGRECGDFITLSHYNVTIIIVTLWLLSDTFSLCSQCISTLPGPPHLRDLIQAPTTPEPTTHT
jgi:hypothetical protein